jgi:hypothetical protein
MILSIANARTLKFWKDTLSLFHTVSIIHQMKKNYKALFFFQFGEILTYYFH